MTTGCFYHDNCVAHDPGPNHSERAARLTAIVTALREANFPNLRWETPPLGQGTDILRVHDRNYVDYVFASVPKQGYTKIEVNEVVSDYDGGEVTTLSPRSGDALRRSVGAAIAAVDAVVSGRLANAFCATRPPGHHALTNKAMGFCVFNNVAIAARYAQVAHKLNRVAIVDFDVHHGNGTQQIFENDSSVFLASMQQLPLWPETGYAHECGVGNILNVPVPPDAPRRVWLQEWNNKVLPRLRAESFDLLVISAGFDAHRDDPKGSQNLETQDYFEMTADLIAIARQQAGGRLISILEGGYDIRASAESAVAHVRALCTAS